ncbi:hypothetical protein BD560DRAFT_328312 [Blakeslea trispora]|nr:hypothetical protein BD560DRAFT_328312 [Blakeslea trispora]
MEEFLLEAEPLISDLKAMAKDIDEKLKVIVSYYGEDPTRMKAEEFFGIVSKFMYSFEKARIELHEARERALRRQRHQEMQSKVGIIHIPKLT